MDVFERFDKLLDCNFFTAIELYHEFSQERIAERYLNSEFSPINPSVDVPHFEVLTSTMGCSPGFEMIVKIRDYYNSVEASPERALHYREWVNNDRLVARYCAERGFKYKDETQHFGDEMVVYGTGFFGHAFCVNPNYSITYHHNAATWDNERWTRHQKRAFFFDKIGLLSLYNWLRDLKKKLK